MNDLSIIKSDLLSKYQEIIFGFSTRPGGVSPEPYNMNLSFNVGDDKKNVIDNRKIFFESMNIGMDELAIPRQVQGSNVERIFVQGGYDNCDGLVTNSYGIFLTISTADCLPVFLYDPKTKAIGAIHSGWKGCELGIVIKGINLMQKEFNSSPSDLVVYIGPGAGVCCYEVGEDIVNKFSAENIISKKNKYFLDLKKIIKSQLENCGVNNEKIEINNYCTICNPNLFHSYRRDKARSGRMMGVIGMVR